MSEQKTVQTETLSVFSKHMIAVDVRKLVNAVPVLNFLLVYGTERNEPTSLLFSMLIAEIAEAINPHVTPYNRALDAYRKSSGLETRLREYRQRWGVDYGALVQKELTDEEKAALRQDHDSINDLLETMEAEKEKLLEQPMALETPVIPLSLLQGENIRLSGRQMHGLLWLIERER